MIKCPYCSTESNDHILVDTYFVEGEYIEDQYCCCNYDELFNIKYVRE